MNWRTWLPLVMALVLGLLAAKVGRDIVSRGHASAGPSGKFSRIVVAHRDLPPGHAIAEHDVLLVAIAADNVPRSAFRDVPSAVGRVLLSGIVKDQAILESDLAATGSQAGAQALVPAGMRAMTIEVNEFSGLAGLLAPGCRVDIVSTLQDDRASAPVAKTIVQNIKVIAVGRRLGAAKPDEEEPATAKSVTLLLTPPQVEAIELASSAGRSRLVLRGPLDAAAADSKGLTVADLVGRAPPAPIQPVVAQQPATRPADPVFVYVQPKPPAKPAKRTVEVIQGSQVTRVEFDVPPQTPSAVTGQGPELAPAIPGNDPN